MRRTWVLILPLVVFIAASCNAARVCGLACVSGLGWIAIYLNNYCGFIRHEDSRSNTLVYAWYEKLMSGWLTFLDAMIATCDRGIGTREDFMQEAASLAISFSDPRVGSAGPTREAPARQGRSGRQPSPGF